MLKKFSKRIEKNTKKMIKSVFNSFGYTVSKKIDMQADSGNIYHRNGLTSVNGNWLYQNIADIVDYSPLQGKTLANAAAWDQELRFMLDNVVSGSTVIDVGANIGYYTLMLSDIVGSDGRVFAFEPGLLSFNLLNANILVNQRSNITVENYAVADSNGEMPLYRNKNTDSSNFIYQKSAHDEHNNIFDKSMQDNGWGEETVIHTVKTVALDEYFNNNNNNIKIDYIKIDIQGGEYRALRGMKNILQNNPHIKLTIEYAPYLQPMVFINLQDYLSFLRSFGFLIDDVLYCHKNVSDEYLLTTYTKESRNMTTLALYRQP
jgi:FkbM family methyltransferase